MKPVKPRPFPSPGNRPWVLVAPPEHPRCDTEEHRRRAVQHYIALEDEAAFLQHAPRRRIGAARQADHTVGAQWTEGGVQRLLHQLRREAVAQLSGCRW